MRSGYAPVQATSMEDDNRPPTYWSALLRQDLLDWALVAIFIVCGFSTEGVRALPMRLA